MVPRTDTVPEACDEGTGGAVYSSVNVSESVVWKGDSGVGLSTGGESTARKGMEPPAGGVSVVCKGGEGAGSSAINVPISVVGPEGVVLPMTEATEGFAKELEVSGGVLSAAAGALVTGSVPGMSTASALSICAGTASPCSSTVDSRLLVSWTVSRFVDISIIRRALERPTYLQYFYQSQ